MSKTKVVKKPKSPKGSITGLRLTRNAPALIKAKDYNSLARLGAAHGAYYLKEELLSGKSEQDAAFMPEAYLYQNGKCSAVCLLDDVRSQGDMVNRVTTIYANIAKSPATIPAVVLTISAGWFSELAAKNRGRASKQSDRVNMGVGTVYTATGTIVAAQGKRVFIAKAA